MDSLIKGIMWRYVVLLVAFGGFIILVVSQVQDDWLFVNLLITLLALASIPFLLYFLLRKQIKKKK